jgi:hypothetical protein
MNWKMIVASHWKVALLLLQLGLFILMTTTVNSVGDIVDNPGGP